MQGLLEKVKAYLPEDKLHAIEEAYKFAEKAHDGQTRLSGEPFIEHPIQTALFLAELNMDPATITAALLHDVVEDCNVSIEQIRSKFGPDVAKLVDGVTKLAKIDLITSGDSAFHNITAEDDHDRAASMRKMLVSMAEDIRVVLIKLADRLHNMKTLKAHPRDRRLAIAQETLDIYAPLAHRLGIWDIKWRLEDLAFRYLMPGKYREISRLLSSKRVEREQYVSQVSMILKAELDKAGISAEVTGRPKHIYSIYKKVQKYAAQGKEFREIYDLFALRVLVKDVNDCYSALGVVHSLWRPIPGQFDDYIANSKENMYKSLHTTVLCIGAVPIEIQVRTYDMHQLSEYGVAAHWRYKEEKLDNSPFEQKMTWVRQLLEWQREVSGAEQFLESVKTDIFRDQVFVYTPKGDIKEMPAGSTPVDFAYRIHTELGHRCIGAKVNGKLVPLDYQLKNGDTAEILASKAAKGPSLDWLNQDLGYVKTANALEKVRQWFRRQERSVNIQRGRDLFNKEMRRLSMPLDEAKAVDLMKLGSAEELFAALGTGSITASQLAAKLTSQKSKPQEEYQISIPTTGPSTGMEVLGVGDLLTRIARCCAPIRGDEIIGFITRNRGVTVHKKDCPNILAEDEKERLIKVDWGKMQHLYPVRLKVEAWDRVGLFQDITTRVSEEKANIASVVSTEHEDGTASIYLTVHTTGIAQLSRLFSKLEGVRGVISVARSSPTAEGIQQKSPSRN